MWVKLLHYWHIIVGETCNAEIDKEVDETEESALPGKDDSRKKQEATTALHTMNQTLSYKSGIEWS